MKKWEYKKFEFAVIPRRVVINDGFDPRLDSVLVEVLEPRKAKMKTASFPLFSKEFLPFLRGL